MISVNKANCMSIGYCWNNCSQVFAEDVDGKAKVIPGQEYSTDPGVLDAQENCCLGGIVIT